MKASLAAAQVLLEKSLLIPIITLASYSLLVLTKAKLLEGLLQESLDTSIHLLKMAV
jgi:hypothetical protein